MKNLLNLSLVVMLGCILSFILGFTPLQDTTTVKQGSHVASPEKVEQIALLNTSIKLDTAKNAGLCDTCYTSAESAVIENRLLANKVSEQNYELSELISKNEIEIQRLRIINGLITKLRTKYELNYNAYFDKNLRVNKDLILSIDTDFKRKVNN